jgi:hypothetical protein
MRLLLCRVDLPLLLGNILLPQLYRIVIKLVGNRGFHHFWIVAKNAETVALPMVAVFGISETTWIRCSQD